MTVYYVKVMYGHAISNFLINPAKLEKLHVFCASIVDVSFVAT
jgi:hypothetical protein